jgi:Tat protein translocase TatB subunit
MLNVGPLELLVVLAVALIVVGPERLPELARSVGRALRQLRQIQDEVRDMVATGVDDDVRQAATEFKKATGDVARAAGMASAPRKVGRTVRDQVRETVRPTPARRPRGDGPSLPDRDAATGEPAGGPPVGNEVPDPATTTPATTSGPQASDPGTSDPGTSAPGTSDPGTSAPDIPAADRPAADSPAPDTPAPGPTETPAGDAEEDRP